MRNRCQRLQPEAGFILIIVLWLMALLSLIALGFSSAVRSHLRLATNAIQSAKAEAAADAGVQLAALSLLAGLQNNGRANRWPVDGSPSSCSLNAASLTIRIQDTGGRVSINLANERMLQALFLGLGASREVASRYADRIMDYRDPDSDRRPNGAEKPEYIAAGRLLGPKNAPFDTVDELNQVLGLPPDVIAAAAPFLTVHSRTAGLDPRTTSPELAALLSRGASALPAKAGQAFGDGFALPAEFIIGSPQQVFSVTSQARLNTGAIFVRETVIELLSPTALPLFKMWKRGVAQTHPLTDAEPPPC